MRANRYPVELALRYRSIGDHLWSEGVTANISRSGVLFRGEKSLGIDTEVEFGISLSILSTEADVVCRGRIVRVEPSSHDNAPLLAAAFLNFRVRPASAA